MKVVGITGGLGSGKSTIARVFKTLGVPVFDSDSAAKSLYTSYPGLVSNIEKQLNITIRTAEGLQFKELGELIFRDASAKLFVESLVHPMVGEAFDAWILKQRTPYVLFESALLFQSGSALKCNWTIAVTAPVEERIARVKKRNAWSVDEIQQRMQSQMDENEMRQRADFCIDNGKSSRVVVEVWRLHHYFLGE
jgi:dephospho-CoA kinase